MLKFGYRRPMMDPQGLGLVTTKAKKFDRRRMWRSDKGDILRPCDFHDEHLLNTVRYLRRRAAQRNASMGALLDASGDDVQDSWGSELPTLRDEEHYPILSVLCREIKRRGLQEKEDIDSRKEIGRPFDITLHKDSQVPLRLTSELRSFRLAGEWVSFNFVNCMKDDIPICLDKVETTELRDTLTKILDGWR